MTSLMDRPTTATSTLPGFRPRGQGGLLLIAAVWLLTLPTAADAREVYKYRMPGGQIMYTNEISTQGTLIEVLPAPPPAPKVLDAERRAKLAREQSAAERAVAGRLATLDAVEAEIKAATQALTLAKAAADAGVEPLPGERLGIKRIGAKAANTANRTRMSDAYWERQRELNGAFDAARQRLDAAYIARDALR